MVKYAEGLHSLPIHCSWTCHMLHESVKCSHSGPVQFPYYMTTYVHLVPCREYGDYKLHEHYAFVVYIKLCKLNVNILKANRIIEAISISII